MNILICGGAGSGKTALAETIAVKLSAGKRRVYIATMVPFDDEDRARIARHVASRAHLGFETLEAPRDLAARVKACGESGAVLVDSVTALLLNEIFALPDGKKASDAAARCIADLRALAQSAENTVFVTDFIFSDAERYEAFTEDFRAALGAIDRALADLCDVVAECCAKTVICHKGGLAF